MAPTRRRLIRVNGNEKKAFLQSPDSPFGGVESQWKRILEEIMILDREPTIL
jgi:hypothetical protein